MSHLPIKSTGFLVPWLIQFCCLQHSFCSSLEGPHLHNQELQNKQYLPPLQTKDKPKDFTYSGLYEPTIENKHLNITNIPESSLNSFWSETSTENDHYNQYLCPVSSNTDLMNKTYHYFYPMDVFQSSEMSKRENENNMQTCVEYDFYTNETFWEFSTIPHTCPIISTQFCPVTKQNILHAVVHGTQLFWPKSYTFCDLKATMTNNQSNNDNHMNVFVFGMSVTTGVSAQGCKSFPAIDWDANDKDWLLKSNACAWPHYLEMWLQSISKVKVNVYNLAYPGATSLYTAQKFNTFLQNKNASTTITSRDIVLIDFSTTDLTLVSSKDPASVESAMHMFVKQLEAHYSTPKQTPKVIILETETNYKFSNTIRQQYINVAKHYGFHFWSLSNAVHSGYTPAQQDNSSASYLLYTKYLNKDVTLRHDTHPPWFVHLYMADLLSALFVHEIKLCTTSNSSMNSSGNNLHNKRNVSVLTHSEVNAPTSDILVCNESVTPLLSISYDAVIRNQSIIGSFELGDYWKLTTDLKGRGGFIRSLEDTDRYSTHDNATLEFYFDAYDSLSVNSNLRRQLSSVHHKQYMLSLTYLSSYVNVGVVDVYICNQYMTTIDALWTDKKVSLPTIKNIVYKQSICTLGYVHSVLIKHRIQQAQNKSGNSVADNAPRFRQMFKITSIDICQI